MCEFKIIKKNDGSQIGEDIIVLSYTNKHELILKDILGSGEKLDSALILDVNTLNQTATIIEHPLIKEFLKIIHKINNSTISISDVENLEVKLNDLKNSL